MTFPTGGPAAVLPGRRLRARLCRKAGAQAVRPAGGEAAPWAVHGADILFGFAMKGGLALGGKLEVARPGRFGTEVRAWRAQGTGGVGRGCPVLRHGRSSP